MARMLVGKYILTVAFRCAREGPDESLHMLSLTWHIPLRPSLSIEGLVKYWQIGGQVGPRRGRRMASLPTLDVGSCIRCRPSEATHSTLQEAKIVPV